MSTRSSIAIKNLDGTVESVYCHWDGYLSHNGRILFENYKSESIVRELLSYGDISSLDAAIGEVHGPRVVRGVCTFYRRDHGQTDGVDKKVHASIDRWFEADDQEYMYIFDVSTGQWHMIDPEGSGDLITVDDALHTFSVEVVED